MALQDPSVRGGSGTGQGPKDVGAERGGPQFLQLKPKLNERLLIAH